MFPPLQLTMPKHSSVLLSSHSLYYISPSFNSSFQFALKSFITGTFFLPLISSRSAMHAVPPLSLLPLSLLAWQPLSSLNHIHHASLNTSLLVILTSSCVNFALPYSSCSPTCPASQTIPVYHISSQKITKSLHQVFLLVIFLTSSFINSSSISLPNPTSFASLPSILHRITFPPPITNYLTLIFLLLSSPFSLV